MWIVAIGSIDMGHVFIGPFDDEAEAEAWIKLQDRRLSTVAWALPVKNPNKSTEVIKGVSIRIPAKQ
jgi:hypothetical protein